MNWNNKAIFMMVAALALPLSTGAQNSNIYSWTDENGVRHFSDREPTEATAEVERIPVTQPPAATGLAAETLNNEVMAEDAAETGLEEAAASPGEELSYADQQRQAMEEKRKAQQEKRAERQRICLQATNQLAQIEPSRRVFYTDEAGDTTRLDDEERVRMVEENKKLVAEYCD